MRKVRFKLESEEGAAAYKVIPIQSNSFVPPPLSRTHQEVGVSSRDGCSVCCGEVHFQRISTHGKPVSIQRDMVDATIFKVVRIGGVIPVQRLTLDEADDHFLWFSALEQIIPVERCTASGYALRTAFHFGVGVQGIPLF